MQPFSGLKITRWNTIRAREKSHLHRSEVDLLMRILIAPDKFKGSLGAEEVAEGIRAGVRSALPTAEIEILPLADGGEGTAETIRRARGGEWVSCATRDALGREINARYAWMVQSALAVLEMSAAAGLQALLPNEGNPVSASTFGVGEMLLQAAARGAREIIIGLGGSATNDGGFGLARALGFRFLGRDDRELAGPVATLFDLSRIEPPDDLSLPRITAACDVSNPLLGPHGATRTFGAQKGATPEQLETLERSLARLAEVAAQIFRHDYRDVPGAGAAGGLGFGLLTFCGAQVRSGFDVVAEAIELRAKIERADVVITGEGKLDRQTLAGKAPAGVARMARSLKKPVFAIVGQATDEPEVRELFNGVATLDDTSADHRDAARLLEIRAGELARRLR
jgi:glycerate kinase